MKIIPPPSPHPLPDTAKCVFRGKIFDVYQWEQVLYDGSVAVFEKLKRPDTVIIYPVLDDGRILMIEEQKPGGLTRISAPGGRVEASEDILAAARRELMEETGHIATEWHLWDSFMPLDKLEWSVYIFIAKGVRLAGAQRLDAGERVSLRPLAFEELIETVTAPGYGAERTTIRVLRALQNPEEMTRLRQLFTPTPATDETML